MKKFVIFLISALVIFVFFMLNYLVWDKENLQNQRDSDKIEQDWLQGQNRILNSTVEELEKTVAQLEDDISEQKSKIIVLDEGLRISRQQQSASGRTIIEQENALNLYKSFLADDLKSTTEEWFLSISQKRYEDSIAFLDKEFKYFGEKYVEEDFIKVVSSINSIELIKNNEEDTETFVVLENGSPYIIKIHLMAKVSISDDSMDSNTMGLSQDINSLEIGFSYNFMSKNWLVSYMNTDNIANP